MRGFSLLQAVSFASSLTIVRLISLGSKAIEGTAPLKSEDQGSRGCGKDAWSRDLPNARRDVLCRSWKPSLPMRHFFIHGEYGMDRLQTDFENAWRASSTAIEGIALLFLSVIIVCLEGCLNGIITVYRWIEKSNWLIPGKEISWK